MVTKNWKCDFFKKKPTDLDIPEAQPTRLKLNKQIQSLKYHN